MADQTKLHIIPEQFSWFYHNYFHAV